MEPSTEISMNMIIILISAVSGVSIFGAVLILCLYFKKKQTNLNGSSEKKESRNTIQEQSAHNVTYEQTDETRVHSGSNQNVRPASEVQAGQRHTHQGDRRHGNRNSHEMSGRSVTTNGRDPVQRQESSLADLMRDSSGISLNMPIRISLEHSQHESNECLNTGENFYMNLNENKHNRPLPVPQETDEAPEVPARRPSQEPSSIYLEGTKAYELYTNALQDYEMESEDIQFKEKLGKGHFGNVFSGVATKLPYSFEKNKSIAIKTMRSSATDAHKEEFLYEYEIMKLTNTINHDNITKLLGCVTKTEPCMIVLELMTNGNLRSYLRATRSQDVYYNLHGNSSSLTERQLLQFALDIANGMEGIAKLQLLHRDLATRNILLDENLTCKIADFGFAKDVLNKPEYTSKSVFKRPRPTRWLPPESLFLFKHSIQSDVWSYGIVLWEIVTLGNLPYPNMSSATKVQHAIQQGYIMPCPRHCSPDIYRVMSCCWEEKPNQRPLFPQLVDKMKQLLEKATHMIDMNKLEEDHEYVEILPPDEQEIFMEYEAEETLA